MCVFPFTLTLSPLFWWKPSHSLFFCVSPPNNVFPLPLPRTQWTFLSDTYFNLFLLLAPALFFLPQFFLPMARSHATFTPSALLLSRSLLHLLASLLFTSFQLASLNPLSQTFLSVLFLLCIFFPLNAVVAAASPQSFPSFSSSSYCPMSLSSGGVC